MMTDLDETIKKRPSRLRFNVGFLLEAIRGTTRVVELDYPAIEVTSDVTLAPLKGQIIFTRTSEGIYVSGELHSTVPAECVRCLEATTVDIEFSFDDIFYYPFYTAPEGEAAVKESGIIDLAPLVRELSLIAIPMQPLCRPDCQGLCMECGQNLNEADCGCEVDDIDPRLAKLSELL
jgi:uncharacterized protein